MESQEPSVIVDAEAGISAEAYAAKLQELVARRIAEQNLMLGVIGAVVAAIAGASIWAAVTVVTEFQIGWMAVGVGFLVGFAVRKLGKGMTSVFGYVGAVGALGGCLLGNLLSVCSFAATANSVPFMSVVVDVLSSPSIVVELLKVTFSPMDLVFYGIAVYEGYRFSFRPITQQDLDAM
jgi:hypothetical protein